MKKRYALSLLLSSAAIADVPALNLSLSNLSVSGLSSGGYMATQFHIAHSDVVTGAAVIAAGPYYCARNSLVTALGSCIKTRTDNEDLPVIKKQLTSWADSGDIADLSNLTNDRVWLLRGTEDATIAAPVADALYQQYASLVTTNNIHVESNKAFAHHFPTERYGTDCKASEAPFLGNCNYDAAGEMLSHLYPEIVEKSPHTTGQLFSIDQTKLAGEHAESLANTGYVYVPENCADGNECKLHISFHGCNQHATAVGTEYAEHTGINNWADTNKLVVLYPQAKPSLTNPQGCWDWWGYTDEHYATQKGQQVQATMQIAQHLAGKKQ
jgi:predicted peptidase